MNGEKNVIVGKSKKYYLVIYDNEFKSHYVLLDNTLTNNKPTFEEMKLFKLKMNAITYGSRFYKSNKNKYKGFVIKEVICPMSD